MKENNNLSPKLLYLTKLALVILVLSVFGLFVYFFQPGWFKINIKKAKTTSTAKVEALVATTTAPILCPDCVRRSLDGVMVKPEFEKLRPYAVMIDNFPAARPQSGLSAASLVYEATAEGGITRYLAFFAPDQAPNEIGPVRSARPYFLNWAKELSATYVHVGGSPDALELAKNLGKSDVNQFFKGAYFWRSNDRMAPHNVLTSADNLNKYRSESGESGAGFSPWQFKDAATSTEGIVSRVNIKYSAGYAVSWQYQSAANEYERNLDSAPHLDASGVKITAKNIIVQLVSFKVTDEKLRLELTNALSGKALLCQDGVCQMGLWKKNSAADRTKYYNKNGSEFVFNAGTTWVEVIDDLKLLEY